MKTSNLLHDYANRLTFVPDNTSDSEEKEGTMSVL
jgi:hypothetical protein